MDFRTVFDATAFAGDFVFGVNDLASDDGLETAVILSLFTDRQAEADDELPSVDGDRRGWWGDLALDAGAAGKPDLIGSRLWLLSRAKQLPETLKRAEEYCREALQWLIDDGIARRVDVLTQWQGVGFMAIRITIFRVAGAAAPDPSFDLLWKSSLSA